MQSFDSYAKDSSGAFLVQELERVDPTINAPLATVTWWRDVDLREDVTIADEFTSFTNTSFAAVGGIVSNGKNFISPNTNTIPNVSIDIGKTLSPMNPWGLKLDFTIFELEKSIRVGRPIDIQKIEAINLKWNMDIDEQVYIGDAGKNLKGLMNNGAVTVVNVPNGAGGSPLWSLKTPQEILNDINTLLVTTWTNTGYAVMPDTILLPPEKFAYLSNTILTVTSGASETTGSSTLLTWLMRNSMYYTQTGKSLNIFPAKWAKAAGDAGKDRMVAYSRDRKYVRFPLVPLNRTPLETRSLYHEVTYFGALGTLEVVYPETMTYADGI